MLGFAAMRHDTSTIHVILTLSSRDGWSTVRGEYSLWQLEIFNKEKSSATTTIIISNH